MRILFDTEILRFHPCGMSAYALRLLEQYHARFPDDALRAFHAAWNPAADRRIRALLRQRLPDIPTRCLPLPRRLVRRWSWPVRLWMRGLQPDLVHTPANWSPPWLDRVDAPRVITLHDTAWHPDAPAYGAGPRYRAIVTDSLVPALARPDTVVVTVSALSRREIEQRLRFPPERIVVTPLGVPWEGEAPPSGEYAARVLAAHGLAPGGYLLAVGLLQPRKNYPLLLDAFDRLHAERPDARLVVVGHRKGDKENLVRAFADRAPRVLHRENIPQGDLRALYAAARLVACPALHEGFGLPTLEAMDSGVPVVYTAGSAMDEVAGDAGVAVPPGDVDAFHTALRRLWDDPDERARRIEWGRARARAFTWRACAEKTRDAYTLALNLRRRTRQA